MGGLERRDFLMASAAGLGALAASAAPAGAELPVPPAMGRSHRDAASRRVRLYELLGDLPDRELKAVYAAAGHPERWRLLRYDVEHQETPEGRREVLAFLRANL